MKNISIVLTVMLTGCAGIPYDAAWQRQPTEAELRQAIQQGRLPKLGEGVRARIQRDGTITLERY